jgi:hypothetical protein
MGHSPQCNQSSNKEILPLPNPELWKRVDTTFLQGIPAVCTVQTFLNPMSGPMLYMFARYYLSMGWAVIIYDRFGAHREHLEEFLTHPRLKYFPYTMFQLMFPETYNEEFMNSQVRVYAISTLF